MTTVSSVNGSTSTTTLLTPQQISALDSTTISTIKPSVIAAWTANEVAALSPDAIPGMSPSQVSKIPTEFIAQALQVAHAHRIPGVLSPTTRVALGALAKAGLLPAEEATALVAAERLWRAISAHLRLTVGRRADETLPAAVAAALLGAVAPLLPRPAVDQSGLRTQMREVSDQVRAIFLHRIGPLDI